MLGIKILVYISSPYSPSTIAELFLINKGKFYKDIEKRIKFKAAYTPFTPD
jgi:hypothetical protein